MSTVDELEGLDAELSWPFQLGAAELAESLALLNVPVDPASPVAQLLQENPGGAASQSPAQPPAPLVARALRVLAAPRQLLLLRLGAGDEDADVLGFLHDGEFVVRFDVGSEGCLVAEPCERSRFPELVWSLAGVSVAGSDEGAVLMSRTFLEAIVGLRLAGLFAAGPAGIPHAEAEEAIAAVTGGTASVPDLLQALEADGVLSVEDGFVRPRASWTAEHPYLTTAAHLKLEAIEIADLAADRDRRKGLAILGTAEQRVVFLPPACQGRDVLLEFTSATAASLAGAVERLLAPPLSPPVLPVVEFDAAGDEWLGGAPARGANGSWRLSAAEELINRREGEPKPPAALLAPRATVEVVSWGRAGRDVERAVLALAPSSAAEWTLDGSLVRWRELAPTALQPRIDELVAVAEGRRGAASIELSPAEFEQLLIAPVSSRDARLRDLPGGEEARWQSLRAARREAGELIEFSIFLGSDPERGSWRFEPDEGVFSASAVDRREVHEGLASVLDVSGRSPDGSLGESNGTRSGR